MKYILILLSLYIINATGSESSQWYKRNNIESKNDKLTWYLGIAESRNLNEAIKESDLEAKKNLIELSSENFNIFQKAKTEETTEKTKTVSAVYIFSDILPIPLRNKRIYKTKKSGKWIVYTDIAINTNDKKFIHENRKKLTKEQVLNDYELNDEHYNQYHDYSDSFLDTNHLISWTPLKTSGVQLFSIGYELSFYRRSIGLEYNYTFNEDKDEYYNSTSEGYDYIKNTKQQLDFNIALSKKYNQLIYFYAGGIHYKSQRGTEDNSSQIKNTEDQTLSGFGAGFKYRYLSSNDWGGYILNLRHESLSGKDYDKSKIETESSVILEIGLFGSF